METILYDSGGGHLKLTLFVYPTLLSTVMASEMEKWTMFDQPASFQTFSVSPDKEEFLFTSNIPLYDVIVVCQSPLICDILRVLTYTVVWIIEPYYQAPSPLRRLKSKIIYPFIDISFKNVLYHYV